MYNYGEVKEEEKKYSYFKKMDSGKATSAFLIELIDGSIVSFPYSYYAPTQLENKKNGNYTINLIGGGLALTLHFKNFDDEKYDFLKMMRANKVDILYEFDDSDVDESQPILEKVEINDMVRGRKR